MRAALAYAGLILLHTLAVQGMHAAHPEKSSAQAAHTLDCKPPAYVDRKSQGIPIPPLRAGGKPNFIVILTDDLGWDDIGLHNPRYVRTPSINKFVRNGTLFDNFYVSPECAPTRAALLTGRHPLRTGTVRVNAGYDFINSDETTAAQYLDSQSYHTAHFGKWHNIQTLGYEPWHVGFQQAWFIDTNLKDGAIWHNGNVSYVKGYTEQRLAGVLLDYLSKMEKRSSRSDEQVQPFFVYYAPRAMHTGNGCQAKPGIATRCYPSRFKPQYQGKKYSGIAKATTDAWAAAEYLDAVVGRVLDYVSTTKLAANTYVMIMGDNGPQLLEGEETPSAKLLRMPSRMQGSKSVVLEGGIRNFLAVQGPGVEAGVTDSTLLDVTDILPTLADLAAGRGTSSSSSSSSSSNADWDNMWDGMSFANLLSPAAQRTTTAAAAAGRGQSSGVRGVSLATQQQQDRLIFSFGHQCWGDDALPLLGPDRELLRPQPLLEYEGGGLPDYVDPVGGKWLSSSNYTYRGFDMCIAVRHKQYKWIGLTGKVYRFEGGSHVELPCNEVPEPQATAIAAELSAAARAWWARIAAEPHSFTKPVFYVGLDGWAVTNLLAQGAHALSHSSINVLPNALTGFVEPGDSAWWSLKVLKPGIVSAVIMYISDVEATFSLSIGTYHSIVNGTASGATKVLPAQRRMTGVNMGTLALPDPSSAGKVEVRLQLVSSTKPGMPVFINLGNIQLMLGGRAKRRRPLVPMEDWDALREKHYLPAGQSGEESPYSPYDAEGIAGCEACQPPV